MVVTYRYECSPVVHFIKGKDKNVNAYISKNVIVYKYIKIFIDLLFLMLQGHSETVGS